MTLLETAAAIRAKKVSSTELTTESLRRISQANPKLNAFITVCEEHALARASRWTRRLRTGFIAALFMECLLRTKIWSARRASGPPRVPHLCRLHSRPRRRYRDAIERGRRGDGGKDRAA